MRHLFILLIIPMFYCCDRTDVTTPDNAAAPHDDSHPQTTDAHLDSRIPAPDGASGPDRGGIDAEAQMELDLNPIGHTASSCGDNAQGLVPVDCTSGGDLEAACVFSNHCLCSVGYICEANTLRPSGQECDPGSICIQGAPEGARPDSCGGNEGNRTDCTSNGDEGAQCVFSDHCLCSDGYRCDEPEDQERPNGSNGECSPSVSCVPQ